jgi:zinc/manganese transport system permease protein
MTASIVLASDPATGLVHMLGHDFIQRALFAGSAIAVLAGLVGYFVVLRAQVFAGDALSHVAYTGSLAALAAGIDLRIGLFAATVAVGLLLGLLGGRGSADDVVIGTVFAWVLGLGVFFLALYTTHRATGNSAANVNVLFGSLFGLSSANARDAVWIATGAIAVLAVIARPLLFASIDPTVAAARRVPVRSLGALFMALVGVAAAEASQAVGALLLLGLIAAPAGAAHLLTARPWRALALSGSFALVAIWIGVAVAYAAPKIPVSFAIMATLATEHLACATASWVSRRTARPPHASLRSWLGGTPWCRLNARLKASSES